MTALTIALAATLAGPASATPSDSLLITASQLRERLSSGKVVLLHIGERVEYDVEHIPGARFLPYEAISTPHDHASGKGLMLELPPPERLDSLFESLGVSDDSHIVLYWGKDWLSPTTRVFFTLDYLGVGDRTSILDGGLRAWKAAGGTVTQAVPAPARASLTVRPRPRVVADVRAVQAATGDGRVAIIDARDERFYRGDGRGDEERRGHIPGARSLPFTSFLGPEGRLRDRASLAALLDGAGATTGKRVISYCHIGQQATVVYFVARLLGRDAALYDGSWDEWVKRSDLPVKRSRPER